MKKWHLESIIIHDKAKKLSLPDMKHSLFQNNADEIPALSGKQIGLLSSFRQKMLGYIKRDARANW